MWSKLVCFASYELWFVVEVVYHIHHIGCQLKNFLNNVVANPARGPLLKREKRI